MAPIFTLVTTFWTGEFDLGAEFGKRRDEDEVGGCGVSVAGASRSDGVDSVGEVELVAAWSLSLTGAGVEDGVVVLAVLLGSTGF